MRYWLLANLCFAAIIAYVQRLGFSHAGDAIQASVTISESEFGEILSAWGIGYAILQLPAGWLADRWGSKPTLAIFAASWSLLTGAAALADDFHSLQAIWFAM